ncbi:hypothetical protein FXV77_10485 [Sphingobacterium phlebotomi]|uniref:Uncharacterized protein n=1 Tax=Sphingobacterium phlebotomi TaxID=2605433 RepID=A0A5D4H6E3_9SPHI|nr:hypothetical protein [Sphingobacterium phlebotomi]TYR36326.1 hypothetical protein FXV77_10485 [Sphingobacterium phlebotomi]
MIEVIQKPSIRKADKPDVIMARMDYVIICRVIEQLNKIGMSDDELSFLLGKPNNYVFGFIVKPSDKNRFNENQIDLLPYILNCTFTEIIPNDTERSNIQLYHTKAIDDASYKGFSHIIYSYQGEGTRVLWRKQKAPKGSTRSTNLELLALLKRWIDEGYFEQKRAALEIYKKLDSESSLVFQISEIEKCMKILCGTRHALLQKKSIDGVLRYWKEDNS